MKHKKYGLRYLSLAIDHLQTIKAASFAKGKRFPLPFCSHIYINSQMLMIHLCFFSFNNLDLNTLKKLEKYNKRNIHTLFILNIEAVYIYR